MVGYTAFLVPTYWLGTPLFRVFLPTVMIIRKTEKYVNSLLQLQILCLLFHSPFTEITIAAMPATKNIARSVKRTPKL